MWRKIPTKLKITLLAVVIGWVVGSSMGIATGMGAFSGSWPLAAIFGVITYLWLSRQK